MTSKTTFYRLAQETIDKCEGYYDPREYALFRAAHFRNEGDSEGATLWDNIASAITEIISSSGQGKPH